MPASRPTLYASIRRLCASHVFLSYGLNCCLFLSSPPALLSSISLLYPVFRILMVPPPPCIPASISTPWHFKILFGFSLEPTSQDCTPGSPQVCLTLSTHSSTVLQVGPTYDTLKSTTCPL